MITIKAVVQGMNVRSFQFGEAASRLSQAGQKSAGRVDTGRWLNSLTSLWNVVQFVK